MTREDRLLACWAKLDAGGGPPGYHPLLWHMTDVAVVARELWQSVLSPAQRTMIGDALGLGGCLDSAGLWCALLAGLHDLGKASPSFQLQAARARAEVAARLQRSGLCVPVQHHAPASHGTVTAATLPDILASAFGVPHPVARGLGTVAGGHHGTLPSSRDVQDVPASAAGGSDWDALRRDLVTALSEILGVPEHRAPDRLANGGAMALAGLVSVADWIGSNTRFFPHDDSPDLSGYPRKAQRRAEEALDGLGWRLHPHPRGRRRSFTELFPGIPSPNGLQQEAESIASNLDGPGIVIIEAPMGEGKTEAALCLADHWTEGAGLRGFYFALPTQATSNQMFTRIRDFLESSCREDPVQLQLLHGHASLSAEFEVLRQNGDRLFSPQYPGVEGGSDHLGVTAAEWFTYRKRGLLAAFGVGTIDQALLAGLRTRHVFVRLFGLSGKTVIIDEVHAYDTYMTTLLERVLEWLAALGSPVVLLSATLPRDRRAELISAYRKGLGQEAPPEPDEAEYPRISWASGSSGSGSQTVGVSPRSEKAICLEMINGPSPSGSQDGEPFQLDDLLGEALAHGGCAAVICNTVRRAQEVYRALRPRFPDLAEDGHPELDLLHSQYPFNAREEREKRSLARYGRPGDPAVRRPYRSILVATQVIEQSLDLDFDLMISDMAPADLLLQRAGRLHRHPRPSRPPGLERPRLLVLQPGVPGGVPRFDPGTAAVYDPHVLLRSWLALSGRADIRVPGDVEAIIESVYDDNAKPDGLPVPLREAWEETLRELRDTRDREKREAAARWIRSPSYGGQLWRLTEDAMEEDAPGFHEAHQALTRLTSPSAPSVLLHGGPGEAWLDTEHPQPVDLDTPPSTADTRLLLQHSVNVSDRRVVFELLKRDPPASWRRSPLLRNFKAVFLNDAGVAEIGRHDLCLDAECGVMVSPAPRAGEL